MLRFRTLICIKCHKVLKLGLWFHLISYPLTRLRWRWRMRNFDYPVITPEQRRSWAVMRESLLGLIAKYPRTHHCNHVPGFHQKKNNNKKTRQDDSFYEYLRHIHTKEDSEEWHIACKEYEEWKAWCMRTRQLKDGWKWL